MASNIIVEITSDRIKWKTSHRYFSKKMNMIFMRLRQLMEEYEDIHPEFENIVAIISEEGTFYFYQEEEMILEMNREWILERITDQSTFDIVFDMMFHVLNAIWK